MLRGLILWWLVVLATWTLTASGKSSQRIALKRILSEWKEISQAGLALNVPFNSSDADECGVRLSPLASNLLEWHFSFKGMEGSAFENGLYHGRIRLHPEYPQKAPSISMCTPSGRWEVGSDICLSATAHHQESWNPNWNLRTLVLSLRGFMTTQPREIGSIHSDLQTQTQLAALSRTWRCKDCHADHESLLCGQTEVRDQPVKYLTSADQLEAGPSPRRNNNNNTNNRSKKLITSKKKLSLNGRTLTGQSSVNLRSSIIRFIQDNFFKCLIPLVVVWLVQCVESLLSSSYKKR